MVHNVVQPDLIDSLATTYGYSYLLDMFSSPLFQFQEDEDEEEQEQEQEQEQIQQQEMSTEDGKFSKECLNESSGQTSRSVPDETLNRMEVHESLNDNVDTNGSGPVQSPDHRMDTLTTETKPPKRPRQKGLAWTQTEHELFLEGVEKYGRGDWKSIAKTFVLTRTPAQVASHAQKYFGRLKSCKKPGAGRRYKSMALKDSHAFPKPFIHSTICAPPSNYSVVHPTFYVPPSDNGNVPLTFSNPPMDFGKIPLSFTNPLSEESRKICSTFSFPSADSATFTCTDPFPPLKLPKVLPTIYAPPSNYSRVRVFPNIYVPPLDNDQFREDVYHPSTDFITNPTSDNNIIHPTTYIPPSENKYSDADLYIPSPNPITTSPSIKINVQPIISVPSSNNTPTNPDAYFPSLDFLNDSCLGSISAPPTNPVSPLNSSFADPDESPTLDFLDAPPLNDIVVVHQTTQVPPSDINTFHPTSHMSPNDLSYIQPAVSNILTPEYSFTPSITTCQTIPTSPYDVAYMEQMFIEQHFLHQNRGFKEFMGM